MIVIVLTVVLISAFLLGAVPWAYILSRAMAGVDIRTVGDGNVGARNTFKQIGRRSGLVVGVLDFAKGTAIVLFARQLGLDEVWVLAAGMAVVAGHDWSPFLHFRGGQGFAPTAGVLLALMPLETLAGVAVAGIVLAVSRHWNFSQTVGFAFLPVAALWSDNPIRMIVYMAAMFAVVSVKKFVDMPLARRSAARRRALLDASEALDLEPEVAAPGAEAG